MNSEQIVFVILLLAAGFAVATKPTDRELRQTIYDELRSQVNSVQLDDSDDFLSGTGKFLCRLSPDDCARMIFDQISIDIEDKMFFKRAKVELSDDTSTCLGVFNTWHC